ncbi:MAG: precorrin-2 C(20)-methyltransferase [Hyphomicrobiales bacterium]|nr:MAG: precorrin-2 C(20)-methyltransferase [Hyphomicrobiales bacterium]
MSHNDSGTLYLVGVGPGDPELLTLRAVRILRSVHVVAYPSSGEGAAFARDIAAQYILPGAQLLPVTIPMTVDRGPAQAAYDGAADAIAAHLRAGRDAAWLCEGDPLFYGSAMYVLSRIAPQAPVQIVPGVTSLTAAAAAIARPLAARNEILKVLPAPLPDDTLRAELRDAPAVAIIKVGRHFDRIRDLLRETGHAKNAVVVEYATTLRQRITPLEGFGYGERPYFSTILCYRGDEAWG